MIDDAIMMPPDALVGDDEISAHAQHAGLQDVAQHLGARTEIGINVGRADIFLQIALVGLDQRAVNRSVMPSARIISALRWVVSASTCRWALMSIAALAAPREIRSVSSVIAMIAAVPSSAVKPIAG